MKSRTLARLRAGSSSIGVRPEVYRRLLRSMRSMDPANTVRRARAVLRRHAEIRVYRHTSASLSAAREESLCRRDELRDLLKYEPTKCGHSGQALFSMALQRLERGEHVYTLADEHKLLHYGWLVEDQQHACLDEVRQCFDYPEHSVVLYDFYTHPQARGRGTLRRALECIAKDAAQISGIEYIYICVPVDDVACRQVVEDLEFEYQCSLARSRSLGYERLSRSDGPVRVCGIRNHTSIA